MADNPNAFKHWFDAALVERIATQFAAETPSFDAAGFEVACLDGLADLELKDRVRQISAALRDYLEPEYPAAIRQILAVLPPARTTTDSVTELLELWPYCHFVETYGLEYLDLSLDAMFELTQRFSAEFAVRPFLLRYPEQVLTRLQDWSTHPNPHVRRWVSEGTRPRLPWGIRLQPFVDDPAPILPLLEALRHDPEEYVRRSVANNLNDIAKDHPDLVVEVAERWWPDSSADEQRMIRHALRSLVKGGHGGALAVLGFAAAEIDVHYFTVTAKAAVGEHVEIALELESNAAQSLLIDYTVHHQRANGSTSPKVFKWTVRDLAAGELLTLKKRHSLRIVTTRKYYLGAHDVELLVNGDSVGRCTFELVE